MTTGRINQVATLIAADSSFLFLAEEEEGERALSVRLLFDAASLSQKDVVVVVVTCATPRLWGDDHHHHRRRSKLCRPSSFPRRVYTGTTTNIIIIIIKGSPTGGGPQAAGYNVVEVAVWRRGRSFIQPTANHYNN